MLRGLDGVMHVFVVDQEVREKVLEIEKNLRGSLGIKVVNEGVEECLKRQTVICIIKDRRFRPPPTATVMLTSDTGVILGEEVLPDRMERFLAENTDRLVWLSEDFVMYPDRIGGSKEVFLMPPVAFVEMERYAGVADIVSCSPSAPSDMMLRESHGFIDDPKLATIMVGFNADKVE